MKNKDDSYSYDFVEQKLNRPGAEKGELIDSEERQFTKVPLKNKIWPSKEMMKLYLI